MHASRKVFRDIREHALEAGLEVPKRGDDNYFPMVFDVEVLLNNWQGFADLLLEPELSTDMDELAAALGDPEMSHEEAARTVWRHITDKDGLSELDEDGRIRPQSTIFTPKFVFMQKRMLNFLIKQGSEGARKPVHALEYDKTTSNRACRGVPSRDGTW